MCYIYIQLLQKQLMMEYYNDVSPDLTKVTSTWTTAILSDVRLLEHILHTLLRNVTILYSHFLHFFNIYTRLYTAVLINFISFTCFV